MLPSEIEQGSPEWKAIRCGKITASRMGDVLAKGRGSEASKTRQGYLYELMAERLTGVPEEHYSNGWMARGTELEPLARAAYEVLFDKVVEKVGFVVHPTMPFAGCSPDGLLLGEPGGIQIKCPKTTTHLKWMQKNTCPEEYIAQCYWEMCCNPDREWWEFCSYAPDLPERLQLFVVRIRPEKELMEQMEAEVMKFNNEIEEGIQWLTAR
jgi:putative phage-type endonuclease